MAAAISVISCASNENPVRLSQSETIIKYETNTVYKINDTANTTYNVLDYYNIYVPYAGGMNGYFNVSYKDTNRLNKIWFAQIQRKGENDGKVFAIRNRANGRDMNNFQNSYNRREDYYYLADNGDIYYKGGDKTNTTGSILIKRFVGAVIVDYRTVKERTEPDAGVTHQDVIHHTGEYTVGAIYKMAINVNEARRLFADAGGGPTDGAYEFVAARKMIWFFAGGFTQDTSLFVRQFYNTNFMEVLVLNPYANEGNTYCLGVDSYYAYYGNYRVGEGATPPIDGFTAANYPYMTDEKLYLAQRPETIIPLLNHTTTFTDASRWWSFLALPGHKY